MSMNHVARLTVAATVATVAVVGIALLLPSSSPSATAQESGSRQTVQATENGVRFSFKLPTNGWERHRIIGVKKSPGGGISLNRSIVGPQGAEAIIYWTSFPNGNHTDPCGHLLSRSVGPSAAALAAAVATAPGTKLERGPSDLTLGGRPAKNVVLTVRKDVGCDPGFFYTWRLDWGGAFWRTTDVGDTIRVWIVAVDGTRLFIAAATKAGGLGKEIQQIVESIRFG